MQMNAYNSITYSEEELVVVRARLNVLQHGLSEQKEDITTLRAIVESIKANHHERFDEEETKKFNDKMRVLQQRQNERFIAIDKTINSNILDIKKERTAHQTVILQGKEVRKLESGVRTLQLFVCDVINMLGINSKMIDRVDDRIYYFTKRSKALEEEISALQVNMPSV